MREIERGIGRNRVRKMTEIEKTEREKHEKKDDAKTENSKEIEQYEKKES